MIWICLKLEYKRDVFFIKQILTRLNWNKIIRNLMIYITIVSYFTLKNIMKIDPNKFTSCCMHYFIIKWQKWLRLLLNMFWFLLHFRIGWQDYWFKKTVYSILCPNLFKFPIDENDSSNASIKFFITSKNTPSKKLKIRYIILHIKLSKNQFSWKFYNLYMSLGVTFISRSLLRSWFKKVSFEKIFPD